MKARVKQDMVHIFLDEELSKDTIIEVEHFAYGRFYKIISPKEVSGMTIDKESIEFIQEANA